MWNNDFCVVIMHFKGTKILAFNQCRKSDKTLSIIYSYLEPFIKRKDGCKNNFEKSSTKVVGEHIP